MKSFWPMSASPLCIPTDGSYFCTLEARKESYARSIHNGETERCVLSITFSHCVRSTSVSPSTQTISGPISYPLADRLLCVAQKLLQLLSPNTAHLTRTDAECQERHSEMVAANVNHPNAPCCMSCLVDNPCRTQVHCAASRGS
jgi:hypothetical protein